jgi:uncharacterized protein (DUF1778 family)
MDHDANPVSSATTGSTTTTRSSLARKPVSVRLSAREVATLTKAAAARGLCTTAYLRRAALKEAGRPLPPLAQKRDALAVEVARAIGLLGRVSSSANQVARLANSGTMRPTEVPFVLARIERHVTELRLVLASLAEARGA